MPPSPALRISRETDENHKRGRSLEAGIGCAEKEDDLALFNEVQNKEKESFLLQSNYDDFNDIFSTKLKNLSDFKIGVSIPARGESSDLLNAVDKNDYDWLMTPPESPLFSSLDDEAPAILRASTGRPRSQPVLISRSSMGEKDYRSARGSLSPRRTSPSPRSGNTVLLQARSSPSSASATPTFPRGSGSKRLSPPPSKPTTPTGRRMSTGSIGGAQSRTRGASPDKTCFENSPKIRAWQLNIPGFSDEVPPNLRTSLADRPRSYVRGSSPASRNGSRSRRQSMSPTASGSASSSHSHERNPFSSYSRGSVASSGDDDIDSMPSRPLHVGSFPKTRASSLSKKSAKILSSSAPKRPFDMVLRQVDKKSPHNMFRPLLSSAPNSTLYAAKGSIPSLSLTSRNSSITTSSNASSDQAIIEAEHNGNNDASSEILKNRNPVVDELFDMDPAEASIEDVDKRVAENLGNDDPLGEADNSGNMDRAPGTELCSKCCRPFHSAEIFVDGDLQLCWECKSAEVIPLETVMIEASPAGDNVEMEIVSIDLTEQFAPMLENISDKSRAMPSTELELCLNSKLDDIHHEGQGLAVLLKRSSSVEGRIVPNRSCSSSNASYDGEFFYLRGSFRSLRSSVAQSSLSMSSSVDLGSSGRMEALKHRQLGGSKHKRSVSLVSGAPPHPTPGSSVDGFEAMATFSGPKEQWPASECVEAESKCSGTEIGNPVSSEDGKNWTRNHMDSTNEEPSDSNAEICFDLVDATGALQSGTLDTVSETEFKDSDTTSTASHSDFDSTNSKNLMLELVGESDHVVAPLEEPDFVSVAENAGLEDEEEAVVSEAKEDASRSLTLEEATEVILLCSSIAHEIAYSAVDIATSREIPPTGVLKPAALPSPPVLRSRTSGRRISKTRKRKPETETKSPQSVLAENEGKSTPRIVVSPASMSSSTTVPPKLESKCNCTIM